jgi:transcriptional regulator with XRE-family HTH domain
MASTRQQILKRVDARTPAPLPPIERRAELRRSGNLRLKDVAELLGVSGPTISYWERGLVEPQGARREAYLGLLRTLEENLAS